MTRFFFALAVVAALCCTAHADVVLTFDTDLDGFEKNTNGTSALWSADNGGSMCLTADGGWAGNTASLGGVAGSPGIQSNALLWAEFQLALQNGGTFSYDIIINEADVNYTNAPGWFETVMIFNSAGGWDQQTVSHGIAGGDWPLAGGQFTQTVTFDIVAGAAAGGDGIVNADDSGGWTNLHFGLNNEGGTGVTDAIVYFDNITVSANSAVPEPGSLAFLSMVVVGLVSRRRR